MSSAVDTVTYFVLLRLSFTIARLSLLAHHYTHASRAQFASARFGSNTCYRFRRHTAPAFLRICAISNVGDADSGVSPSSVALLMSAPAWISARITASRPS